LATRTDFRAGSRPCASQAFCVATPVGQVSVWQICAWMQPIASIASRATLTMSQPRANANSALSGRPELARADERDLRRRDAARANVRVDAREAELERQRHVVGEDERRRAGAALAAVDRHEVDAAVGRGHQVGQLVPERDVADRRLDAHRQAGLRGEHLHEVEHLVGVGELRVPGGRDAVLVRRHAADLRDLLGHLRAGSSPPRPGLAPWLSLTSSARTGPRRDQSP
jgi:hypothetical protein